MRFHRVDMTGCPVCRLPSGHDGECPERDAAPVPPALPEALADGISVVITRPGPRRRDRGTPS